MPRSIALAAALTVALLVGCSQSSTPAPSATTVVPTTAPTATTGPRAEVTTSVPTAARPATSLPTATPTTEPTATTDAAESAAGSATIAPEVASTPLYTVTQVVDGDTIRVSRTGAAPETVRLIGIDTPEVVDPRQPVQCFGREASDHAKELLAGQQVRIEQDPTQDTRDKYGRLLAYVWLEDGTFFNEQMIADGYAKEYTYDHPYEYQAEFRAAEATARDAQLGLWAPDTCNGDTKQPASGASAPTPTVTNPAPASTISRTPGGAATSAPKPAAPTAGPKPAATSNPAVNPTPYYANCTAARAAGAAPIRRGQPGYRPALDRDNDGIACE
jgi:micrococcal nuclease